MDHEFKRQTPQTVLVTGAGSGLGLESALFLSRKGFAVWGSVLNPMEGAALRDEAQRRRVPVRVLQMDITKQHEIDAAVGAVLKEAGRIDALVHFAGVGLWGFFEDLTLEEVRHVHDVNIFGAMAVTQAVLPHMRAAGAGRIVMTSSILGRIGGPGGAAYTSSKFALEGFMECLALEMVPFGIHVSVLEPGLVQTPMFGANRVRARRATDPNSPYYAWFCQLEKHIDALLLREFLTPADVAKITHKILASGRPRLRYVVGTRAKFILSLRRHLPSGLFDRLWSSLIRRLFTASRHPPKSLP